MTTRRLWAFRLVLAAFLLALIEVTAAVATSLLTRRSLMVSIPSVSDERIAQYARQHHPVLGWGPAFAGDSDVARLEPRNDPSFAARGWRFHPDRGDERVMDPAVPGTDDAPACISTYGDSFTAGSEVEDDATYPHDLGVRLGCRVANFGVPGYGTDQALMLSRAQRQLDHAPITILGHIEEDLLRNVNQYRQLLDPGNASEITFKPSFSLVEGQLHVNPIPVHSDADFRAFVRSPDSYLAHDAFRDRPRRGFPHTWALARWALADFHVRAQLAKEPRFKVFYQPEHPSQALTLTAAIMRTFASEASASGRQPFVLLIPAGRELLYFRQTGQWIDQPLVDALTQSAVPVIHAGPLMMATLDPSEDPCGLFRNCFQHFNARGYQLLADVVAQHIETHRKRPSVHGASSLSSE